MREMRIEASRKYMQTVQDFVKEELEKNPVCTRSDKLKIHMVVDEIFGNICDYAYTDAPGEITVWVDTDSSAEMVKFVFSDEGTPFNPLLLDDPDITLPASERSIGGLGLFMVKNAMDDISYESKEGKNILTIIKRIGEKDA